MAKAAAAVLGETPVRDRHRTPKTPEPDEKGAEVWARTTQPGAAMAGSLSAREVLAPSLQRLDSPELLRWAFHEDDHEADEDDHEITLGRHDRRAQDVLAERLRRTDDRFERDAEAAARQAMKLRLASDVRFTRWWTEVAGMDRARRPPAIDPVTWQICRVVIHRPKAARELHKVIANNYGGGVMARVADAAYGGGRWDETDLTARRVLVLCFFMLRHARPKEWGGRDRLGRKLYQGCVWGTGRGALQALLAWPDSGEPLSTERLTHSKPGCLGIFERCARAGVFKRQRVPEHVAWQDEIGPTGYTFNRYWVTSLHNSKPELVRERDLAELEAANAAGFEVADHGAPIKIPRGRYRLAFGFLISTHGSSWLQRVVSRPPD